MAELKEQTGPVIEEVKSLLPDDFPEKISSAIFDGLQRQADRLP